MEIVVILEFEILASCHIELCCKDGNIPQENNVLPWMK
jgi:hypothetical protein